MVQENIMMEIGMLYCYAVMEIVKEYCGNNDLLNCIYEFQLAEFISMLMSPPILLKMACSFW